MNYLFDNPTAIYQLVIVFILILTYYRLDKMSEVLEVILYAVGRDLEVEEDEQS